MVTENINLTRTEWIKTLNFDKYLNTEDYPLITNFTKIGDFVLTSNKRNLWELIHKDETEYKKRQNGVYIISINNKIVKIGGTKVGMKGRINSYLCGHCTSDRKKANGKHYPGKMSVTNAYIYNTILYYLLSDCDIQLWFYPIQDTIIEIDIFGEKKKISVQNYDYYEQKALNEYKKIMGNYPPLSNNGHKQDSI